MKFINPIILLTSPDNVSDGWNIQKLDLAKTWLIITIVLLVLVIIALLYILHLKDIINKKFPQNNTNGNKPQYELFFYLKIQFINLKGKLITNTIPFQITLRTLNTGIIKFETKIKTNIKAKIPKI